MNAYAVLTANLNPIIAKTILNIHEVDLHFQGRDCQIG